MEPLTAELARFRCCDINWNTFYRRAEIHMMRMMIRMVPRDRDARREIIADFYPRFQRICAEYQERGASLDAYVYTSLRFFTKSWLRHRASRTQFEIGMPEEETDLLAVAEEPLQDLEGGVDPGLALLSNSRQRDAVRRQLFICLCKNLPVLDNNEVLAFSTRYGIPLRWLEGVDTYLGPRWERVTRARQEYREHRDRHYAAMLHSQAGISLPNSSIAQDRQRAYRFHRRRWNYYRHRLRRQALHLSNREVAAILGIPKGSVDSAMNNLSRRLAGLRELSVQSCHDLDPAGFKQQSQTRRDGRNSPSPGP